MLQHRGFRRTFLPFIVSTLVVLVFASSGQSLAAEDLSGWGSEDICDIGFGPTVWEIQPGNLAVRVEENNNCASFFRSGAGASALTTTIGHSGVHLDNDYFGIALGFEVGETADADARYLILEWSDDSLALLLVTGVPPSAAAIAGRGSGPGYTVTELALAATLGNQGWAYDTLYDFEVQLLSRDRLIVAVDGGVEFDLSPQEVGLDCFPVGGFAFYNYSQQSMLYSDLELITGADYDGDGNPDASDDDADGDGTPHDCAAVPLIQPWGMLLLVGVLTVVLSLGVAIARERSIAG